MSAVVPLREDFTADDPRLLSKAGRDAGQSRRLLALAKIYDGGSRSDAARIGVVGLQTVGDWALAFNADGPAGLIDSKAPGKRPKLDVMQRQAAFRPRLADAARPFRGVADDLRLVSRACAALPVPNHP